jgi:uncharacterized membrane protein YkvA (DUF1232 family)
MKKGSDETKRINTFTNAIRKNVRNYDGPFSEIIKHSPDFFELFQSLLKERNLDKNIYSIIESVVSYFVLPEDILPESKFGAFAYVDDLYLCVYAISKLTAEKDVIKKYWTEKEDVFELATHIKKEIENAPTIITKEELEEIKGRIEQKYQKYKLLQNLISPYLMKHLAEKAKFNNMLSLWQRKDLNNLSNRKMRGLKLTPEQETYLENLLSRAIGKRIVEAKCKDDPCFSCEKLRKIKKLLRKV